jgi:hypothetical protein
MTKTSKKQDARKAKSVKPDTSNLDFDPNAWDRFVGAVHAAAKHGPVHRATNKKPSRPKGKKSAAKMGHKPHSAGTKQTKRP